MLVLCMHIGAYVVACSGDTCTWLRCNVQAWSTRGRGTRAPVVGSVLRGRLPNLTTVHLKGMKDFGQVLDGLQGVPFTAVNITLPHELDTKGLWDPWTAAGRAGRRPGGLVRTKFWVGKERYGD
jgi:hypothetical protein